MELTIDGMSCGGCVAAVTRSIRSLDPGATVDANLASRTVAVGTTAAFPAIRQRLAEAGYTASLIETE